MHNPLLFLDIDGVLNSALFFERKARRGVKHFGEPGDLLDPEAVARLDRIVTATDCKIVLATSWTMDFSKLTIGHWLGQAGLSRPEAVWHHMLHPGADLRDPLCCARQIRDFLNILPPRPFAILEDDPATAHFHPHALVLTEYATGLTDDEVRVCIERLTVPSRPSTTP